MMTKHRLSIGLEPDLYDLLATEAEEAGRPLADVVRDKLRASVFGCARPPRAAETVVRLLVEGLPDDEVLRRTLEAHPEARVSRESVSWHRSQARKECPSVPTQVEARKRWAQR
jgi:hypothetical protein